MKQEDSRTLNREHNTLFRPRTLLTQCPSGWGPVCRPWRAVDLAPPGVSPASHHRPVPEMPEGHRASAVLSGCWKHLASLWVEATLPSQPGPAQRSRLCPMCSSQHPGPGGRKGPLSHQLPQPPGPAWFSEENRLPWQEELGGDFWNNKQNQLWRKDLQRVQDQPL